MLLKMIAFVKIALCEMIQENTIHVMPLLNICIGNYISSEELVCQERTITALMK